MEKYAQMLQLDQENFDSRYNVSSRYKWITVIGGGTYGIVASSLDLETGKRVAIKKISAMFSHGNALRTLREIRILRYLDHENVRISLQILQYSIFQVIPLIGIEEYLVDGEMQALSKHLLTSYF
jgi:mitogen-activated protein kinase 1/3